MKGFDRDADITARIRDDIGRAVFPPGAPVIETELATRYGVPRAVVRDALVQIVAEGLVEREPNKVATVRAFTLTQAIEVAEARRELETLLARYAAERATPDERRNLREMLGTMGEHADEEGLVRYRDVSLEFHMAISDAARQPVAADVLARLWNHRLDLHFPAAFPGTASNSLRFHEEIATAIAAGDPATAARVMFEHMSVVIDKLATYRERIAGEAPLASISTKLSTI